MHDTRPRLDVVNLVTWKSSPGRCAKCKASARPVIHSYRTVTQVRNCPLYRCSYRRIFKGVWMDNNSGIERSPDVLIGECNCAIDILGDTRCVQSCLSKE